MADEADCFNNAIAQFARTFGICGFSIVKGCPAGFGY